MRTEFNSNTSIPLDPNQETTPQPQTLEEKLTEWANETAIDASEKREIAKQRILDAKRFGSYGLDLSNLGLRSLPEGVLGKLSNLEALDLSRNQFSTLPENTFTGLKNLEALTLFDNQLSSLLDKLFTGLTNLKVLDLANNQLSVLPENIFTNLKNIKSLALEGNSFIFQPSIPSNLSYVNVDMDLPPIEEEWHKGNQELLNFNLSSDNLAGVDARELIKLNLMLDYANKNIDAQFAQQNSSTINQLLYHAQTLSADDTQNNRALEAANKLLTAYLNTSSVKPFAQQMVALTFDPAQYQGFLFVDPSGQQGLTISKDCYEVNILNVPHADQHAPNASFKNGLFVHDISKDSTQPFEDPSQLKSFPLLNASIYKAAQPKTQTLEEKLTEWANEPTIEAGEQRELAKELILNASHHGSDKLSLSSLGLRSLPQGVFQKLLNLKELSLSGNQLSTLPDNIFTGLTKLWSLDLQHNQLSTLPAKIFTGLPKLLALDLENNQLSTLPDDIFNELTNLSILRLENNQLSTLPENIFASLKNLQRLDLSSNQLSTLPNKLFSWLNNLQKLDLNSNQLSTLPDNIFTELTNLRELWLSYNKLSTLPDNIFASLKNLQYLHLYKNQLSTLPENIFNELTNLARLSLDNNQLSTLPDNIFASLKNLQTLFLSHNQLSTLPANAFTKLTNLQELDIDNSPLIFKPSIASNIKVINKDNLPTIEEELHKGNQSLLSFNLNSDHTAGVDARGLIKLNLMLDYANKNIDAKFAIKNSSAINQLLYLAQALSADDTQNNRAREAANKLLTTYLNISSVKAFAQQISALAFDPAQYEGFVFVDPSGLQGLTISKDCYEMNILNVPHTDQHAPSASFKNGLFFHNIRKNSAQPFENLPQLAPFPLLNTAYYNALHQRSMKTFL